MSRSTISLYQLSQMFPNEETARKYMEARRWPNGPVCSGCGEAKRIGTRKNGYYRCNPCKVDFTVRTGSIFGRSHIQLDKWILGIYLLMTARKGISSLQLSKELGIAQSSAWFMLGRLREACGNDPTVLRGIVAIDETYIGGKEKNKHGGKKLKAGRGTVGKTAVLGMRERGGRTKAKPVLNTEADTLRAAIHEHVATGSMSGAPAALDKVVETLFAFRPNEKPAAKTNKRDLSTLELCAGGGGAALGLEQAGFSHAALIDNNSHACATLRGNRPYWNVIEADINRFDATYWRDVDLLSGGLPCPPFSIAGKQLGADDDRDMFPAMLRIVNEVRPRAVMIENVRGILTARFTPFRAKIDKAFDKQGFDTYWTVYNAADFGVPQNRFRAFLVALKRGETKPLQWPIPAQGLSSSVGEAIGDLMGARGWRGARTWQEQANTAAPTIVGGSHKHGGPDLGPTRARREWAELGVDGLGLADEAPAEDFKGMPRLTVPMVARLQTFPDNWKFAGAKTQSYRQVGNALPVKLAYIIARAVRQCLA